MCIFYLNVPGRRIFFEGNKNILVYEGFIVDACIFPFSEMHTFKYCSYHTL